VAKQRKSAGDIGPPILLTARSPMRRSEPASDEANQAAAVGATQVKQGEGGRRRKTGKRSDPAFRPTTFFVRKETKRKASRLLEDQEAGKDLSDLVEELLAKWVAEHSNA